MNAVTYLVSSIFTAPQISVITILCVVLAAVVFMNILFAYIWRVKAERKLHNDNLQERRDALLAKLEYLKEGNAPEPHTWIDFAAFGEDDDEDEEEEEPPEIPIQPVPEMQLFDGKQPPNTVILAVDELSPGLRGKLGMRAKRFNGKKFYVRYALGFEAKLRLSDDETKARYVEIMNEFRSYEGITYEKNFSNQRILLGNEVLASIIFAGKRLCIAYALDPTAYADTKYHGDDKSDKKRFAKTPLVVRMLSDNKAEVAKYLIGELAQKNGLTQGKRKSFKYDLDEASKEKLIRCGAMRVVIVDDVSPYTTQYTEAPTDTVSLDLGDGKNRQTEEPVAKQSAQEESAQPSELMGEPEMKTVEPAKPAAEAAAAVDTQPKVQTVELSDAPTAPKKGKSKRSKQ